MFARTPRLLLRPGWIEDAPALAQAIADRGIVDNLAKAPWPYRLDDATRHLSRQPDPLLPDLLILRRTLGTPQLIGGTGFARNEDGTTEFGFWITRSCWGLGFATETGNAMLEIARHALGLEEVVATSFVTNGASHHVLEKLGFRPAGQTRRHCAARNALMPALLFRRQLDADADSFQSRMAA